MGIALQWRIKRKRKWKMKWKPYVGVYRDITPIRIENQMEKQVENEMETGTIQGIIGIGDVGTHWGNIGVK